MAKTSMVADLAQRLEQLEAKAKRVAADKQLSKSARAKAHRAIKLAASAITAKLMRSDALDPRHTISLTLLEERRSTTAVLGDMELPSVGDIASINGVLCRVVP
jgi:hypothetical protein